MYNLIIERQILFDKNVLYFEDSIPPLIANNISNVASSPENIKEVFT